jgi:phospholipase A1/A2
MRLYGRCWHIVSCAAAIIGAAVNVSGQESAPYGVIDVGDKASATGAISEGGAEALIVRMPESRAFTLTEPNFFVSGFGGESCSDCDGSQNALKQVRFRVALRYRIAGPTNVQSQTGLYFTYRQNSFWHLYEDSAPFFDNNYSPGGMFYWELDRDAALSPAIKAFVQHESNGRDGAASRGWNQAGLGFDLGNPETTMFYGTFAAWKPFAVDNEHPALPDYAGRAEIKLYFQPLIGKDYRLDQLGFSLATRVLGSSVLRNVEGALYLSPFNPTGGQPQPPFTPSLVVQIFHGYAENLLTYRERHTVLRVGVAFIR